jgi:hypothetical protein
MGSVAARPAPLRAKLGIPEGLVIPFGVAIERARKRRSRDAVQPASRSTRMSASSTARADYQTTADADIGSVRG